MSELQASIKAAMKSAMKAKDKSRLATIRLIQAEFKRIEVDERIALDDSRCLAILDKMKKQRKDAIEQFTAANRVDLAEKEHEELNIIHSFLPQPLSLSEINTLIQDTIKQTEATTIKDMGKVMAILKPLMQGRADMSEVSQLIKSQLK